MPHAIGDQWLAPTEAARILGLTTDRIRQFCNEGRLTHLRTPLGRLIEGASVEQMRAEREGRLAARGRTA